MFVPAFPHPPPFRFPLPRSHARGMPYRQVSLEVQSELDRLIVRGVSVGARGRPTGLEQYL